MTKAIMDMPNLPENCGVHEFQSAMLHGAPYRILMDGLDCYIYELAENRQSMKFLCRMAGAESTERLGIALLRAATLQRAAMVAFNAPR